MEIESAIIRSIGEVCEQKHLNATKFRNNGRCISWESHLGILGKVTYRVPFSEFTKSLENGMRSVSILIAFADLITQESNKGMIDNIKAAKNRGSRTYFTMSSPDSNIMRMYVPKASNSWDYTTVPIRFKKTDDGEYEWDIPESAELYSSIYDHEGPQSIEGITPEELSRVLSDYTGLERVTSSGVPVLYATQSAREYNTDYEADTEPEPELIEPHTDDPDIIGRTIPQIRDQRESYLDGLHTQSSDEYVA